MSRGKILITPRSLTLEPDASLQLLEKEGYELVFTRAGELPDEKELSGHVPHCVGWLAGVEPIRRHILERAPRLKAISRNGSGIDNIDLEAAKELNVKVLRSAGANARGVAELTVALVFNLARHIRYSDTAVRHGDWKRKKGMELKGRTIGLIGCGSIGLQVAEICLGLGMKVLAYDVYPSHRFSKNPSFRYVDMDFLLKNVEVISLHCPPASKPVLDANALEKMQQGGIIINTARSSLIDHDALLQCLNSGQISGFATDVYDQEPPQPHLLFQHVNVITTAHIGGYTKESATRAARQAVENLIKALEQ